MHLLVIPQNSMTTTYPTLTIIPMLYLTFRETCQWLKFPLNGLQTQSRISPVVGLLPLTSGLACLGMVFPPFLVKQLYRCDSVIIFSFVRNGYLLRRWGWLLGRLGYSINTNTTPWLAEGIMADFWRDFWKRETGTGQQVTQLHDRYMMMMMMMMMMNVFNSRLTELKVQSPCFNRQWVTCLTQTFVLNGTDMTVSRLIVF